MTQSLLVDPRIAIIEKEIESLYHSHFSEQRRDRKLANQRKVKSLRQELGKLLAESLMAPKKAQHVAEWDPFDPQASADFFDPQWMFGCSLADGFHIVIGNPPYVSFGLRGVGTLSKEERNELCRRFPNSAEYKISVYALFMEKCISLCSKAGVSSLIVPDSFLLGKYFSKIRSYILKECKIPLLLLIKDRVFDNVTVGQSVIYLFEKTLPSKDYLARVVLGTEDAFLGGSTCFTYEQHYFSTMPRFRFRLFFDEKTKNIINAIDRTPGAVPLNSLITFRSGLIAKAGQATIQGFEKKNSFWSPGISSGGMVKRYGVAYEGEFLCFEPVQIKSGGVGTVNYKDPKLFVRQTGDSIICGYDDLGLLALNNVHIGEGVSRNSNRMMYVCAILNSSVVKFYYRITSLEEGRTFSQIDIDMLDEIPVVIPSKAQEEGIAKLVRIVIASQKAGEGAAQQFLEDLIDACVMESYFREHMAERDLLFHDTVAPHLAAYAPEASAPPPSSATSSPTSTRRSTPPATPSATASSASPPTAPTSSPSSKQRAKYEHRPHERLGARDRPTGLRPLRPDARGNRHRREHRAMKTIQDCFGHTVRLTDERMAHILEHPEMSGMGAEIERVLIEERMQLIGRLEAREKLRASPQSRSALLPTSKPPRFFTQPMACDLCAG